MNKKIIIVGGGISGLSAGVFALQSGFDVSVYEKHLIAGGLCTGWKREGFNLDGCAHWINGTKKGTTLYKNWQDVGAFTDDELIFLPSWGTMDADGTTITFWCDLDKAEKEWCEVAPKDKRRIHSFFRKVRKIQKIQLPLEAAASKLPFKVMVKFICKLLPRIITFFSLMFISRSKYANKFKSPIMRFAIENIQPGEGNLYTMVYSYAAVSAGNGGLVKGGSMKFVSNIQNKYSSLGGKIFTNSPVNHIEITNNIATGIVLQNGEIIKADYIVTACDIEHVFHDLLKDKYYDKKLLNRIKNPIKFPSASCVLCHFVVENMPYINPPYSFNCEPFVIGKETISHITIRPFNFDKDTFAKGNKIIMQVLLDQSTANYDSYWNVLKDDKIQYNRKKEQIANLVIDRIETKFPNIKGMIHALDVATPWTFYRYTNSSRGAFMSFTFSSKHFSISRNGSIKGLKNIVMAGQWLYSPGGLPLALETGKFAIQRICRKEKLKIHY